MNKPPNPKIMKNRIYLLLLFLFSISNNYAQDYKFGKVSKAELEETFYEPDSSASAAYLYRYRKTAIDYFPGEGFRMITEIHNRIKIYKKKGVGLATETISYYTPKSDDNEEITSLKAYTFNLEEGKIVKVKIDKNDTFDEKKNDFYSIKKVPFSEVKPGSVLDIKYKLISPYSKIIDDLEYQFQIPVKQLNYQVLIPSFYKFNKINKGYYFISPLVERKNTSKKITYTTQTVGYAGPSGRTKNSYDMDYFTEIYSYKAENIEGLRDDEPYVTDVGSYRGGLKFELVSVEFPNNPPQFYAKTWESICKQIYESSQFGEQIKKTGYYQEDLSEALSNFVTPEDKVYAIFNFVKSKTTWNGNYGKYIQNGVRKAYKDGVGNVADINLMLVSMLRYAGLDANPVLVSSRNNGVPLSPTSQGFNYVICTVEIPNKGTLVMDATEPYSSINELPPRAINWNGRIVKEDGFSSWIQLNSDRYQIQEYNLSLKISDEGKINGFSRSRYFNLAAMNYRKTYNHISEEDLLEKMESKYNIEIDNFKITDKYKIGKPVAQTMKFQTEDAVEIIGQKMYLNPLLFLAKTKSPFKLKERKYPIDFIAPQKNIFKVTIEIPEGYIVESLPKNDSFEMVDQLGSYKFKVISSDRKIKFSSIMSFNKGKIAANYYSVLKQFYDEIVKKQSEKIVIIKK